MLAGLRGAGPAGADPALMVQGHRACATQPSPGESDVPESYALFPHMSGRAQNIAYGLEMEKLPRAEIKSARVSIEMHRRSFELSAIWPETQARSACPADSANASPLPVRWSNDPRLLLLDEPLGALDKKLRAAKCNWNSSGIQDEFSITFIVVTHDQEEALVMADRDRDPARTGKLLQCGTPHEIYEHPAKPLCRGFHRGDELSCRSPDARRAASRRLRAGDPRPRARCIRRRPARGSPTVRPERLRLGSGAGENQLTGKVSALAYHGLDLQLHRRNTRCRQIRLRFALPPMTAETRSADNRRPK